MVQIFPAFYRTRFGGEALGQEAVGRPKRRWDDNTKTDLKEIEWEGLGHVDLAQNKGEWQTLINTGTKLRDI